MGFIDKVKSAIGSEGDSNNNSTKKEVDVDSGQSVIPEWAVEDRVNVERRTQIICDHYDVEEAQAKVIAEKLKTELEDPSGWAMDPVRHELEEELDLSDDLIETIVWTESASIQVMDTVRNYLERNEPDHVYKIQASNDSRTHPLIREAADEIEEQSGVALHELKTILIEKAEKYADEGGTPERMDHWVPHERCRFTVVRHVDF